MSCEPVELRLDFCAFVVPKRNAKQAVRRNLIRRVWRETLRAWVHSANDTGGADSASDACCASGASLQLVVRLAKPFSKNSHRSAATGALSTLIAIESNELLSRLRVRYVPQVSVTTEPLTTTSSSAELAPQSLKA